MSEPQGQEKGCWPQVAPSAFPATLLRPGSAGISGTSVVKGAGPLGPRFPQEKEPLAPMATANMSLSGHINVGFQPHKKIPKSQTSFQRHISLVGPLESRTPGKGRPWFSWASTEASSHWLMSLPSIGGRRG